MNQLIHRLGTNQRLELHSSVSTFRAIIITSTFGVRSHHYHFSMSVFRAILVTFSVSTFRAITTSQFGFPSHRYHFSVSVFKAIISFGVQRHHFSVSTFRVIVYLYFGVQSHVLLRLAFRAIFLFGIRIHFFHSMFRATTYRSFRRSEPHLHFVFRTIYLFIIIIIIIIIFQCFESRFQFDTQSPHVYLSFDSSPFSSFLAFRAIGYTPPGFLSHFFSLILMFRATVIFDVCRHYHIFSLVWRSEPFFIPIRSF